TLRRALLHTLELALEGAQADAEHVGSHLATDALALQLLYQIRKHLTCYLRQGRARVPGSRELGDQNRRLTDYGLDKNRDGHSRGRRPLQEAASGGVDAQDTFCDIRDKRQI